MLPQWRDAGSYAYLRHCSRAALAWEWMRRDPRYRAAAAGRIARSEGSPAVVGIDAPAMAWGLHGFEDPDLPAPAARAVWRRAWNPRVLRARTIPGGPAAERFDLARFAGLATVARGAGGLDHVLLSDGLSGLRLDVAGSLLGAPKCLAFELVGLAGVHAPLQTLRELLYLWEFGRLPRPRTGARHARLVVLLRAHDALAAGAPQREIAAVLLSREAERPLWRGEAPSLRLRAQRLVRGARAMAAGGYRALLA